MKKLASNSKPNSAEPYEGARFLRAFRESLDDHLDVAEEVYNDFENSERRRVNK